MTHEFSSNHGQGWAVEEDPVIGRGSGVKKVVVGGWGQGMGARLCVNERRCDLRLKMNLLGKVNVSASSLNSATVPGAWYSSAVKR